MLLKYRGKKGRLLFDAPWLIGGPYVFDPEVDGATCEVDDIDGEELLKYSPGSFRIIETPEEQEAPPPEGKVFECIFCGAEYKTAQGLRKHVEAKHLDEDAELDGNAGGGEGDETDADA